MKERSVNGGSSVDSYEQILRKSNWLNGIPFEHTFRNVSTDQFIRRLLQERGLFVGGNLSTSLSVNLVILADRDLARLRRTFESCLLQSARDYTITVVSHNSSDSGAISQYCQQRLDSDGALRSLFRERVFYGESISRAVRSSDGYVIIIRSGDVLHLSCLAAIYLELSRRAADVCSWNEMQVDFGREANRVHKIIRKPLLERYTLFHFNYIGESFAFRTTIVSDFSDLDRYFSNGETHYLLLTLVRNPDCRFVTIPQFLLLRDVEHVRRESIPPACGNYFSNAGFGVQLSADGRRYSLSPKNRAKMISVIIPFRDQPDLTWLAVKSVLEQEGIEDQEIILVDNQSGDQTRKSVYEFLKKISATNRKVKLLYYDRPFNHSAQCNLGARYAHGECLVFMNNDARLLSTNALSEMAAWSLLPDVGTVGVRMLQDMEGKKHSAGVCARLIVGREFNSPVEESGDSEWGTYNRETWGNSFACAAISTKTYELVGPFDEIDFPNGYNDVDYSMRCRKAGLVNMYLGTIRVYHKPGGSRGRYDEIHQKLLLRRKFPEIYSDALFQLSSEQP